MLAARVGSRFVALPLLALTLAPSWSHADGRYDRVLEAFVGRATSSPATGVPRTHAIEHLYGSDVSSAALILIDKSNAAFTSIGSVGTPVLASLAFDGPSGLLYGTDAATSNLVTVDPASGATTIKGSTGIGLAHGAAIDRNTGILYVAGQGPDALYRVDKATAAATLIGPFGVDFISTLDFDPMTGILYGAYAVDNTFGHLYTIDTATGQATLVADTHRITGMSFDENGDLYAADNGAGSGSTLFRVDKANGSWTPVGSLGSGNVLAIEFDSLSSTTSARAATWGRLKALYRRME